MHSAGYRGRVSSCHAGVGDMADPSRPLEHQIDGASQCPQLQYRAPDLASLDCNCMDLNRLSCTRSRCCLQKRGLLSDCIWSRRPNPWPCSWKRRRRFKPWIGMCHCYLCTRDNKWKCVGMIIAAMAPPLCLRRRM